MYDSGSNRVYAVGGNYTTDVMMFTPDCKVLLRRCKVQGSTSVTHSGITILSNNEVVVCDSSNVCIKVYSKELELKRQFGSKEKLRGIRGVSADEHGTMFVGCFEQSCIQVYSRNGGFVAGLHVFVADNSSDSIVVFTAEGQYVASFGKQGRKEGEFNRPFGVCVDEDGFILVCDCNNARLQLF